MFVQDTKLTGVVDISDGFVAIQRDLVSLEKWSNRNPKRNDYVHKQTQEANWLERSRALGSWWTINRP